MGEAVGVVLWAVRVLGVVRAVTTPGGVGMHWHALAAFKYSYIEKMQAVDKRKVEWWGKQ